MPIIMTIASIPFFYTAANIGWFEFSLVIMGLVVGLMLGVFLGYLMEVKLWEEDGKIVMKGSILIVIIWGIIIAIKILGKNYLNENHILGLDLLTSIFLAITLGTIISRRVIIYHRYRKKKKFQSKIMDG